MIYGTFLSIAIALLYRWLFPFIGHMGICTSAGVIRDFAGPYFVSVRIDKFIYFVYSSKQFNKIVHNYVP